MAQTTKEDKHHECAAYREYGQGGSQTLSQRNAGGKTCAQAVSQLLVQRRFKPLELFKWIIIPLLLILIMIFRPHGLISFTELNVRRVMRARKH